jgi:DNA-binding NtrC family response regulator
MTAGASVLVVDDDENSRDVLIHRLRRKGYSATAAENGAQALELIASQRFDLVLLDIVMPGLNGLQLLQQLRGVLSLTDLPIIMVTARDQSADVVHALELGANDYVTKPFDLPVILARIRTQLALKRAVEQVRYLREEIEQECHFEEIIGDSPALRHVLDKVERVAAADSTVLLLGETGTGKELVARALHHRSGRRAQPLVKLNCGAIPAGLAESELFGHEKGAFTGALQRRIGRFELAHQGTIFLDEVIELPLETQVKLLRVLQDSEFERIGSSQTQRVDVRVIAATNRDPAEAVKAKLLREDLYYRLNVVPLTLPPLRERKEDIGPLVAHFLARLSKKLGKQLTGVSDDGMQKLLSYSWPGNIRELQNVIERAAVLSPGPLVNLDDALAGSHVGNVGSLATLEEAERGHILQVLKSTKGVVEGKGGAAAVLGLHPSTLRSRMRKLGVKRSAGQ